MSAPLGSTLSGVFLFTKSEVLTNPSPLPTVIVCVKPDGTTVTPPALVNLAPGIFYAAEVFSATDTATLTGNYKALAETTDTTIDNPAWLEEWEIEAASTSGDTSTFSGVAASQMNNITTHVNYLGANTPVVLLSPVAQNLNIGPIYTHTDYLNRDGRALFTNITLTNCPDISGVGSSISLNVTVPGSDPAIYPGVITSSTTFYVELNKAQTAVMATPGGSYNIVCTLANGDVIVPITGNLIVTAIIQ